MTVGEVLHHLTNTAKTGAAWLTVTKVFSTIIAVEAVILIIL